VHFREIPVQLVTKKGLVDFPESRVLFGQGAALPSACGGMATPRSHLANEFHQIQLLSREGLIFRSRGKSHFMRCANCFT
jgi:hypothetical protein